MVKLPIGLLLQGEVQNAYWIKNILDGINEACNRYRMEPVFLNREHLSDLNGQSVLIIGSYVSWLDESLMLVSRNGGRPIIVNACTIPFSHHCSSVVFALDEAIRDCLYYLQDVKRKHTVLLGINPDSAADFAKQEIFCSANKGLHNVLVANEGISQCVEDFLEYIKSSPCDSVICANDTIAICLINSLLKENYTLPDDMFIIGMGNSFLGQGLKIPLTSIMFDYHEMGIQAVRLIRELKDNSAPDSISVSLPCPLIVRESTDRHPVLSTQKRADSYNALTNDADADFSTYFSGESVNNIIKIEALFQNCSLNDREILLSVSRGESSEKIAERMFLSDRAVRYRIKNLLKSGGFSTKAELADAILSILNNQNDK